MKVQQQMVRGQIWLVRVESNTSNSIQGAGVNGSKLRPCVLVSNNAANTFSTVLHVVPITSRKKNHLPTHIDINKKTSGLLMDSTALCEQVLIVPKMDFIQCVGRLDFQTMEDINRGISVQFGLVESNRTNHIKYA